MKAVIDLTKEYGLVLEGGGAKGAYQMGAWKAMQEAGVKITGLFIAINIFTGGKPCHCSIRCRGCQLTYGFCPAVSCRKNARF